MGIIYQIQTAVAASFGSLVMGMLNVWPSYTAALLTGAGDGGNSSSSSVLAQPMTQLEVSLLGSLPALGAMLGTPLTGVLLDAVGRRAGGVVLCVPFVISWSIIEASSSALPILAARFLGGAAGGAFLVFGPMFISEVADDSIRGALASGPVGFYCLGALLSYVLGWTCGYRAIVRLNLAVSVASVLLAALVRESPLYLVRKYRDEEARLAIAHYRGAAPHCALVLEQLARLKLQTSPPRELVALSAEEADKNYTEKEKLNEELENQEQPAKMAAWRKMLSSPAARRGFIVVLIPASLQVCMGMVPVQVYARSLFAAAAPSLPAHACSVLFAVVLCAGCLLVTLLSDRAGRRVLLITSSVLACGSMVSLGALAQSGVGPAWLSALMLLFYCFSFNLGAGTIPYVLIAEVFVPEVQSFASMAIIEWVWFLNFVILGAFPMARVLLGEHGVFYAFGAAAAVNALLAARLVPETKGLSNAEIQARLLRGGGRSMSPKQPRAGTFQ